MTEALPYCQNIFSPIMKYKLFRRFQHNYILYINDVNIFVCRIFTFELNILGICDNSCVLHEIPHGTSLKLLHDLAKIHILCNWTIIILSNLIISCHDDECRWAVFYREFPTSPGATRFLNCVHRTSWGKCEKTKKHAN